MIRPAPALTAAVALLSASMAGVQEAAASAPAARAPEAPAPTGAASVEEAHPRAGSVPLTFEEAIRLALDGPAVAAARAAVDEAAAGIAEARSARRPSLALQAGARSLARDPGFVLPPGALGSPVPLELPSGERQVWTASIEIRQLLWDAGRTRAWLEAAGKGRAAAAAAERAVQHAVERAAIGAFAAAAETADLLEVARKAVEEHEELVRQVRRLVEAEQLPEADLRQAEAALEQARLRAIEADAAHRRALAALEELVGRPVDK
ncbi:MAG: hypothetical protein D6718_10035, partial [Acidobacteria bacterium]